MQPDRRSLMTDTLSEALVEPRPGPFASGLDQFRAVVVFIRDHEVPDVAQLKKTIAERLLDFAVYRDDRACPRAHVQRSERPRPRLDRRTGRDRLGVDEDACRLERLVDLVQGVHDALGLDASERPAAQREVEPPPRDVERGRVVNSETNALPRFWGECRRCGAYALAYITALTRIRALPTA
jgi:hypothetical protein